MPTVATKKKLSKKPSKPSKNRKPTKAEAERRKHIEYVKEWIGKDHRNWIKSHPSADLGDLLQYLERVREELEDFDYDEALAEVIGGLGDAYDWLSEWGPIESQVDGDGEAETVGYRVESLEDDIGQVDELIKELGKSFMVKRLPKWKPRAKSA